MKTRTFEAVPLEVADGADLVGGAGLGLAHCARGGALARLVAALRHKGSRQLHTQRQGGRTQCSGQWRRATHTRRRRARDAGAARRRWSRFTLWPFCSCFFYSSFHVFLFLCSSKLDFVARFPLKYLLFHVKYFCRV